MSEPGSGFAWRPALVAAGWTIAHLAGGLLLTGLLLYLGSLAWGPAALAADAAGSLAFQGFAELAAFAFMTWLIGRRALKLSWEELGWRRPRAARAFGGGLGFAAVLALVALVVAIPLARAHWLRDEGGVTAYLQSVLAVVALLAPAALAEELMFRGLPQVLLGRTFGMGLAIVVLSATFGVFHALNPDVTPLAIGNIALAGVLLSLAFLLPGGLWTAWGVHLGWNATIAALDAPVSGLPFRIPWIDYVPGSPAWVSGGAFGPEGGVVATAVLLAGCYFLGRRARKDGLA
ncbi:MAG TPA: CPBP family intramembrane glutamic endopeptidase [Gemmatimonadales bacterium]|nr:CPBP family intramembrane glutamic endopeptidase [Gemmatimonadales bacterium]